MPKKKFSVEQIVGVLKQAEVGVPVAQLVEPGVRIRAEHLYEQLDSLQPVRQAARRELLRVGGPGIFEPT